MTKKNPDDSVRTEQSGAEENALGTEDATQAENAEKNDSLEETEKVEDAPEKVAEIEEYEHDEEPEVIEEKEEKPEHAEVHSFDDIELPEVDYSGYSKNELVDTLGLIIENRPTLEIKDDVERIKILFYKKLS